MMLRKELPGRRKSADPREGVVMEGNQRVGVTEEEVKYRVS